MNDTPILMSKLSIIAVSLAISLAVPAGAQHLPKNVPTKEQLGGGKGTGYFV